MLYRVEYGRAELSERLQTDSFTGFVEEAGRRIQRALVGAFGRDVGAEAAAEALAYSWEHWEKVSAMRNPAGYVYAVGRDRARKMKRRRAVRLDGPPSSPTEPWVEPGLPAALGSLSERQRLAVVLIHGDQWTISEVAELLGLNRGSVKRHLDRGMTRLRKKLDGGP